MRTCVQKVSRAAAWKLIPAGTFNMRTRLTVSLSLEIISPSSSDNGINNELQSPRRKVTRVPASVQA